MDLRNHGYSQPYLPFMTYTDLARDLKHFIEKIVIQKDQTNQISLMGHSMGGKTAMTLALTNVIKFLNVLKCF